MDTDIIISLMLLAIVHIIQLTYSNDPDVRRAQDTCALMLALIGICNYFTIALKCWEIVENIMALPGPNFDREDQESKAFSVLCPFLIAPTWTTIMFLVRRSASSFPRTFDIDETEYKSTVTASRQMVQDLCGWWWIQICWSFLLADIAALLLGLAEWMYNLGPEESSWPMLILLACFVLSGVLSIRIVVAIDSIGHLKGLARAEKLVGEEAAAQAALEAETGEEDDDGDAVNMPEFTGYGTMDTTEIAQDECDEKWEVKDLTACFETGRGLWVDSIV